MRAGERLLDLMFPPKCPFCQTILDIPQASFCPACRDKLPWLSGRAGERRVDFASGCFSPLAYREPVPGAVHRFKFSRVRALARPFGALMAQCLEERLSTGADLICWAPLSKQRRRERGFDQAELLARRVGELTGISVERALEKTRATATQSQTGEDEARKSNVRGAYQALSGLDLTGKRVVLIDDVATSGATLAECASALRQAGAECVAGLTFARAR